MHLFLFFIPYSFSSSVKSASNVNESHPLMSWPCEKVGSQESLRFQESSVGIPPLLLPLLPLAWLPCRSTNSLAGFTYLQFALYCHWHSAVDQQGRGSSYLPGGSESCFLLAERSWIGVVSLLLLPFLFKSTNESSWEVKREGNFQAVGFWNSWVKTQTVTGWWFYFKTFFVLKFSTISVIRKENGRLNCVNFLYQI